MEIIIPVAAVTVIGLICAVMLVTASRFMAVPEDETFTKIRQCLPGANCGACGYAGCDGYAHALADGTITDTNKCVPGGSQAAGQIAEVMGTEVRQAEEKIAGVHCCGDSGCTTPRYDYRGLQTCAAVNMLFSGDGMCTYVCLGLGDCAKVCPRQAISIQDRLARVDPALCIGCGLCSKACPNQLISLIPARAAVLARCSSHDKGSVTRKACTHGCIGCKKCERECPAQAIHVDNNCAVIDYSLCTGCGHCAEVCTTGCITALLPGKCAGGAGKNT